MSPFNRVVYIHSPEAHEVLGDPGAMLSGTKSAPDGQTIYWNACVFNSDEEQIWHGDLNVTRRQDDLRELARRIGKIYVTLEQPFRFEGLKHGMARGDDDRVLVFPQEQAA